MADEAEDCPRTMTSETHPGHTHTCSGQHETYAAHFCPVCRSWWNQRVASRV